MQCYGLIVAASPLKNHGPGTHDSRWTEADQPSYREVEVAFCFGLFQNRDDYGICREKVTSCSLTDFPQYRYPSLLLKKSKSNCKTRIGSCCQ